ncbi:MAG TPA: UDP-2,3-diacylglucosamine diphosphatase [Burkholderiales bacterium]|nr:UDP-2,3-diacylglucosamine diphosphatase [Burkholderiales bacterium]
MPVAPHSLMVADLHLCDSRPDTTRLFIDFLEQTAPHADALYILGDLFEYWLGDDTLDAPLHRRIAAALSRLAGTGTVVYFMHGNRDFLIAGQFARSCRGQLLDDPTLADLYGTSTLLMHGDTLCTDDVEYLKFREQVRNPGWQEQFLAQSLQTRIELAEQARHRSESAKQEKAAAIMDVNGDTVAATLRRYDYPRLVHGHTHRPGRHVITLDQHACERWVLPDWYNGGGYLQCDARGCELFDLSRDGHPTSRNLSA